MRKGIRGGNLPKGERQKKNGAGGRAGKKNAELKVFGRGESGQTPEGKLRIKKRAKGGGIAKKILSLGKKIYKKKPEPRSKENSAKKKEIPRKAQRGER